MPEPQKSAAEALYAADILTPTELAERLKVGRSWIYEKLRRQEANPLPCIKMGRYLRFSWVAVSAWLQSLQRGPEPKHTKPVRKAAGR